MIVRDATDRAISIISSCEPLISNSNVSVKLGDLPLSLFGITDRKTRNITLSKSSFGGQLDESQKYHLLSTLVHEYMHSKQSTISWYALGLDDFLGEPIGMHKKIIRNNMHLRQETYDAWNDEKTSFERNWKNKTSRFYFNFLYRCLCHFYPWNIPSSLRNVAFVYHYMYMYIYIFSTTQ